MTTGEPVTYGTSGNAVGGLTPGGTYYAYVVDPTTIELYNSYNDAVNRNLANIVQLTPPGPAAASSSPPLGSMTQAGVPAAPA